LVKIDENNALNEWDQTIYNLGVARLIHVTWAFGKPLEFV